MLLTEQGSCGSEHKHNTIKANSNFTGPEKMFELTECPIIERIKKKINKWLLYQCIFIFRMNTQIQYLFFIRVKATILVIRFIVHSETSAQDPVY